MMKYTRRVGPRRAADPVIRLFVTNWLLGAALGMICAALVLWLDVARLGSLLIPADHIIWEGLVLLFGGFSLTFGGVVCASAIMTLQSPGGRPDGHRL